MKLAESILFKINEFGGIDPGEIIGYTAEGESIFQPKTPAAQKKADVLVASEAEAFASANGGGEPMRRLFLRLMLSDIVKSEKDAKKIIKEIKGVQKSSNPAYVKTKSIGFTIPNYSFKSSILGSAKTAAAGKYDTNPFPNHDAKYRVILNNAKKFKEMHVSNDIVAFDDYTSLYNKKVKIFIYLVNGGDGTFTSNLRLALATKKLRGKGFDVELVGELSDKDRERIFGEGFEFKNKPVKLARKLLDMFEASMKDILAKGDEDSLDRVIKMIKDMKEKGKNDGIILKDISKLFPKEFVKMLLGGESKDSVLKAMKKAIKG